MCLDLVSQHTSYAVVCLAGYGKTLLLFSLIGLPPTSFSINTKNKYDALRFNSSFEPDVHRSKTAHVTGFSFDFALGGITDTE